MGRVTSMKSVEVKNTSGFVDKVLKSLNKSEADRQFESIVSFQKKSMIAARTQIALIETRDIPMLLIEIEGITNDILEKKVNYRIARHSIAKDFAEYVNRLNDIEEAAETLEEMLAIKNAKLEEAKGKIGKFKEILGYLS